MKSLLMHTPKIVPESEPPLCQIVVMNRSIAGY